MSVPSHRKRRAGFNDRARVQIRGSLTTGGIQWRCSSRLRGTDAAGFARCIFVQWRFWITNISMYISWKMTAICGHNSTYQCHQSIYILATQYIDIVVNILVPRQNPTIFSFFFFNFAKMGISLVDWRNGTQKSAPVLAARRDDLRTQDSLLSKKK